MTGIAAVLLGWVALFPVQGEAKPPPEIDPYTKNGDDAMKAARYSSLGPFRFGNEGTTSDVIRLAGTPLIWVETPHFKLGSGLPEYELTDDKAEKERIAAELQRLAKRLPDVKLRIKKLDPWLRLHLFAQRLEDAYSDFLQAFGLQQAEFPTAPLDPGNAGPNLGRGPHLGMTGKFAVILFDKKSHAARYARLSLSQDVQAPFRWYFDHADSWLYLTAAEFLEDDYQNDTALTCQVISGVSQNFARGFRGTDVALPLAVTEGIGHCFSRRIDARYHIISGSDPTKIRSKGQWDWAETMRARAEQRVFPPVADMLGWTDPDALEWADHLVLWSRMDYLLSREDQAAGQFLRRLKEPTEEVLTPEKLSERAQKALQEATGRSLAQFDDDWVAWVTSTYSRK